MSNPQYGPGDSIAEAFGALVDMAGDALGAAGHAIAEDAGEVWDWATSSDDPASAPNGGQGGAPASGSGAEGSDAGTDCYDAGGSDVGDQSVVPYDEGY